MIIANKYRTMELIGSGCFGSIMKGENIRTKEEVAIKVERIDASTKLLKNETQIYLLLSKQESSGFPSIKWFGKDEQFFYMVMELLGQPVSSFKSNPTPKNKDLSLPIDVVSKIGIQIIERLQKLHTTGLVHRDIKPENLLFGLGRKSHIIHLIDFGFCKSYLDADRSHVKCETGKSIIGTPNFISINMHNGLTMSRRDDLESMVYVLIYLFLPLETWDRLFNRENRDKNVLEEQITTGYKAVLNSKKELLTSECTLIHKSLKTLLQYCVDLGFYETPNYEYIKKMLNV
jgi:serine/threonine protein kinase